MLGLNATNDTGGRLLNPSQNFKSSKFSSNLVNRFHTSGISGSMKKHRSKNESDLKQVVDQNIKTKRNPVQERIEVRESEIEQETKHLHELEAKLYELRRQREAKKARKDARERQALEYRSAILIQRNVRPYLERQRHHAATILQNFIKAMQIKNAICLYMSALNRIRTFMKKAVNRKVTKSRHDKAVLLSTFQLWESVTQMAVPRVTMLKTIAYNVVNDSTKNAIKKILPALALQAKKNALRLEKAKSLLLKKRNSRVLQSSGSSVGSGSTPRHHHRSHPKLVGLPLSPSNNGSCVSSLSPSNSFQKSPLPSLSPPSFMRHNYNASYNMALMGDVSSYNPQQSSNSEVRQKANLVSVVSDVLPGRVETTTALDPELLRLEMERQKRLEDLHRKYEMTVAMEQKKRSHMVDVARLAMEAEKKRKQQQDWEAEQEKIRKKEVYLKRLEADRIAKARQHALVREQQEERQKQSLIHLEKDKQNELLERKAMFSEDIRLEQNLEKARKRIASSTANVLLKASGSNRVSSGRREKDKDTGGETENNNNNANPNNNNASNEENVERIRKAEEDAKQRVLQRKMRERQEKEKAAMEQDRIRLEQEKVAAKAQEKLKKMQLKIQQKLLEEKRIKKQIKLTRKKNGVNNNASASPDVHTSSNPQQEIYLSDDCVWNADVSRSPKKKGHGNGHGHAPKGGLEDMLQGVANCGSGSAPSVLGGGSDAALVVPAPPSLDVLDPFQEFSYYGKLKEQQQLTKVRARSGDSISKDRVGSASRKASSIQQAINAGNAYDTAQNKDNTNISSKPNSAHIAKRYSNHDTTRHTDTDTDTGCMPVGEYECDTNSNNGYDDNHHQYHQYHQYSRPVTPGISLPPIAPPPISACTTIDHVQASFAGLYSSKQRPSLPFLQPSGVVPPPLAKKKAIKKKKEQNISELDSFIEKAKKKLEVESNNNEDGGGEEDGGDGCAPLDDHHDHRDHEENANDANRHTHGSSINRKKAGKKAQENRASHGEGKPGVAADVRNAGYAARKKKDPSSSSLQSSKSANTVRDKEKISETGDKEKISETASGKAKSSLGNTVSDGNTASAPPTMPLKLLEDGKGEEEPPPVVSLYFKLKRQKCAVGESDAREVAAPSDVAYGKGVPVTSQSEAMHENEARDSQAIPSAADQTAEPSMKPSPFDLYNAYMSSNRADKEEDVEDDEEEVGGIDGEEEEENDGYNSEEERELNMECEKLRQKLETRILGNQLFKSNNIQDKNSNHRNEYGEESEYGNEEYSFEDEIF